MPHGKPIWLIAQQKKATHEWADLDELPARLGSPVRYDRRGDIIFIESFEDGVSNWNITLSGDGAVVDLSSVYSRTGLFSARLVAGTDNSRQALIQRSYPYPVLSGLGFEVSFRFGSVVETFDIRLYLYDGTQFHYGAIRWDDTVNEIKYLDSAGAWQTLATTKNFSGAPVYFHTLKLVIDPVSLVYVRVLLNETLYDMSGIGLRTSSSGVLPSLISYIQVIGRAGNNDSMYIDDVIVTQNEM